MLDLASNNDLVREVILLLIAAAVFLFVVIRSSQLLPNDKRDKTRRRSRDRVHNENGPDLTDVGNQLHAVMPASFERRKLMSPAEYRVFKIVEEEACEPRRGYRVFAQTCLGEILWSSDDSAYRSINSKRVDILVLDWRGLPLVAVEYQGNGHYQGTAAARDAVKKEALRKAGVRYVEVSPTDSTQQIRTRVREQFDALTNSPLRFAEHT